MATRQPDTPIEKGRFAIQRKLQVLRLKTCKEAMSSVWIGVQKVQEEEPLRSSMQDKKFQLEPERRSRSAESRR